MGFFRAQVDLVVVEAVVVGGGVRLRAMMRRRWWRWSGAQFAGGGA